MLVVFLCSVYTGTRAPESESLASPGGISAAGSLARVSGADSCARWPLGALTMEEKFHSALWESPQRPIYGRARRSQPLACKQDFHLLVRRRVLMLALCPLPSPASTRQSQIQSGSPMRLRVLALSAKLKQTELSSRKAHLDSLRRLGSFARSFAAKSRAPERTNIAMMDSRWSLFGVSLSCACNFHLKHSLARSLAFDARKLAKRTS